MTERDDLIAVRALELAERKAREATDRVAYGHSGSLYNTRLGEQVRQRVQRQDQAATEANGHLVLFLRDLFSQHDTMTWVGDGKGHTDVGKSKIIIESNLSPMQRDENLALPMLEIHSGPTSWPDTVVGSIKHQSRLGGTETYTGLAAGTLQVMCSSKTPTQSLDLATFVARVIRTHWKHLCHQRWFAITEIAVGGYDGGNPLYSRAVQSSERNALTPVTFTYFHQWMSTVTPVRDAIDQAKQIAQALGVDLDIDYGVADAAELKEGAFVVYAAGHIEDDG